MKRELRVLLGASGGIAAYKVPTLVRTLRRSGCVVRCALTRAAHSFVTPLSLEIVSGAPVYGEEYLDPTGSGEELHIAAADWADVLLIGPATAHTLSRLALGLADDFLSTTALAFDKAIVLAPAMHSKMWNHESVQEHVRVLRRRGVQFIGPVEGELASGEHGIGRMADPEAITEVTLGAAALEAEVGRLADRKVVISAGPTQEALDPVRFLSNPSSGKMGFALAAATAASGAETVLVAGPVQLKTPAGVRRIDVTTAEEMRQAVNSEARHAHLVVMAAAVSDFRPQKYSREKIKKATGSERIHFERTPDILAGLRQIAPTAVIVGFAAETSDLDTAARAKLVEKQADAIIANDISRSDIGFGCEENEVKVFRRGRDPELFPRQSKRLLAKRLVLIFADLLEDAEPKISLVR